MHVSFSTLRPLSRFALLRIRFFVRFCEADYINYCLADADDSYIHLYTGPARRLICLSVWVRWWRDQQ